MPLEDAIIILDVLTVIAKAVPVLGAPVEGSLEALGKILKLAQEVKSNKEKTQELADQAARWLKIIVEVLHDRELKSNHTELEGLRPNMEEILQALNAIVDFAEHCAKQGTIARTWRKSKHEKKLTKLRNTLEAAFNHFKLESHIRIENALNTLLTNTDTALTAVHTVLTQKDIEKLRELKPVFSARYDSRESPDGCLQETREDVLHAMHSWLANPSSRSSSLPIFWLTGLAGTGKSTIIKTFCERVRSNDGYLLASFFASRKSAERRDPYAILRTFAYDLAITNHRIRSHVLSALRSPQDITQQRMCVLVDHLLAGPIKNAQLHRQTIVLAIDALDECQKTTGVEGGRLIELLAQALQHLPVKLLVTGRQEDSLVELFRSIPHVPLRLHEIGSRIIEADMRRILDAGFAEIRRERAGELGTDQWPTKSNLDKLVHLTGPFVIYAATVFKLVGDRRFSCQTRLDQVLACGSAVSPDKSQLFSQIDALYMEVLKSATEDATDPSCANTELSQRVSNLLRTVVLLEEPVSVQALADLMSVPTDIQLVDKDVRALASVLLISRNSGSETFPETVSTFHPSFRDFLVDPRRCYEKRFLVDPVEHQHKLLDRCLQVLNNNLRYDICRVQNPGLANMEIPDLRARLAKFVPEAVLYVCQFCPVHLVADGSLAESVFVALLEFCTNHLFHWLEVLSLFGELSSAGKHLPGIIAWCQTHLIDSPLMQDIVLLLKDAYRALRAYAVPIESYALQVYQSVLATGPDCPLLNHIRSCQVAPRLLSQRELHWSPVLQVIEGHTDIVQSVACSLDGAYIASGSGDHTVRLWDARTGQQLAVFEGHNACVRSVAFSPNGMHIVSGSQDKTVRVWDAQTGKQPGVLVGHKSWVRCVSFSPDGAYIASGSSDKTIAVWDAQTKKQLATLHGHIGWVSSVAFSPDGAHIVSGSSDKTVRVWDTASGRELFVLCGHKSSVCSVAVSPNGAHIVSGSSDKTVRVWNSNTGKQLVILKGHTGSVWCSAFSHNGAHIVSSSSDKTIRVWSLETAKQLAVIEGDSSLVLCVAFLPDGEHIVSGSEDKLVRVYEVRTGKQLDVFESHSDGVSSVAFSPDGRHIVSGSKDKTICVWDVRTGRQLAVFEGHADSVLAVAFSPDGAYIVSGSEDTTIRRWHVHTGKELNVLEGHRSAVVSVAFSLDSACITSGSKDKTIRVWDLGTGKQLAILNGHNGSVRSVAFSLDRAYIVSGSSDQTVGVWDVRTGNQLASLKGHRDSVWSVAFSPDGKHILSRDRHGCEIAWNIQDARDDIWVQTNVSLITDSDNETLIWNFKSGWISWQRSDSSSPLRLCWLPADRRGRPFAFRGTTAAIGARQGVVTILDFSEVIAMLKGLDQTPS